MTFTVDLEWTAHIYAQLSRDICVLLVVLPTVPLPTCCIALQPTVFRAGQVLGTASPCNLRLKDKWRGMTLVVLIIMLITTWLWLHLHFLALTFLISCTRSILEKGTWRFMVIPSYLILMTISTRLWSHGSRIYVMRTPGLAPRTTSSLQHSVYPLSGIRMAWRFRGMAPEFSLWHGSRSGRTCYTIETDFWLEAHNENRDLQVFKSVSTA